jgi:hypothetical protein
VEAGGQVAQGAGGHPDGSDAGGSDGLGQWRLAAR